MCTGAVFSEKGLGFDSPGSEQAKPGGYRGEVSPSLCSGSGGLTREHGLLLSQLLPAPWNYKAALHLLKFSSHSFYLHPVETDA